MDQIPANIDHHQNAENPQQQPNQQPIQPKKKPRETMTLKPEHFQKENGIKGLYKAIQNNDFTRGQDNIEITMKKITTLLKTWHYQMLPKYSFDLFLQRCRALGNHKFTQAYMSKVRQIHKGEDQWGSSQPTNQDALDNVNLDHLNPNAEQQLNQTGKVETLEHKFENFYRNQDDIDKREERRMEIEHDEMKEMQGMLDDDDDDDEDDMMKQMEAMDAKVQEKKEILKGGNNAQMQTNKQVNPHSDSEQVPYVPDGFDDVDFQQESSYNN